MDKGFQQTLQKLSAYSHFAISNVHTSKGKTHKQHKSYTLDALMDKISHPRWIRGFSRPFRNFLLIHILQFRIFILQRAKTHKQHKSYTRDALMAKNSHPRWMGGVSRPFRNFLLILIFQFRIFILRRAKTHKQHKS